MSKDTIYKIFVSRCYDESEDDPWVYMPTLAKDYLPTGMKPRRKTMAEFIIENFSGGMWQHQVSIDPCSSLLPRTTARSEEQQIAAMGSSRFMSAKSRLKDFNLRAPATARSQGGNDVLQVFWTPILTRGKVRIWVSDPAAAERDRSLPSKLNDSASLSWPNRILMILKHGRIHCQDLCMLSP